MTQNCSCHGSGGKYSQTVAAVLERPRYSPGLILEDSDLTSAVDYTQTLSRLLFRNLFGCGVICGLRVTALRECGLAVTVEPGLALDGCGDPVQVPRPITITIDKAELERLERSHNQQEQQKLVEFWVVLCGREKMCAPRSLVCESDEYDAVTQPTRIRALAEVSLAFERPECICECNSGGPVEGTVINNRRDETDVDCHHDHETRVECAPDCGCGTACACGCCLLLAHVELGWDAEVAFQRVDQRGVRRFVRPKLLPDPIDREEGWNTVAPTTNWDAHSTAASETAEDAGSESTAASETTEDAGDAGDAPATEVATADTPTTSRRARGRATGAAERQPAAPAGEEADRAQIQALEELVTNLRNTATTLGASPLAEGLRAQAAEAEKALNELKAKQQGATA